MTADVEVYQKLKLIVAELFMRGKKLNISLVFISQSYFDVPNKTNQNTLFYHENG